MKREQLRHPVDDQAHLGPAPVVIIGDDPQRMIKFGDCLALALKRRIGVACKHRQHAAPGGASRVHPVEAHGRPRSRDPRNFHVAGGDGAAVLDGEMRVHDLFRVGVEHAHHGRAVGQGEDAFLDGEGGDGGGHVAAVGGHVDHVVADADLREGIVHVGVVAGRAFDPHGLGQGRDAAAQAVELAAIGVGTAHDGAQHAVAFLDIGGHVLGAEEHGLRGAAAEKHGGGFALHDGHFWASRGRAWWASADCGKDFAFRAGHAARVHLYHRPGHAATRWFLLRGRRSGAAKDFGEIRPGSTCQGCPLPLV